MLSANAIEDAVEAIEIADVKVPPFEVTLACFGERKGSLASTSCSDSLPTVRLPSRSSIVAPSVPSGRITTSLACDARLTGAGEDALTLEAAAPAPPVLMEAGGGSLACGVVGSRGVAPRERGGAPGVRRLCGRWSGGGRQGGADGSTTGATELEVARHRSAAMRALNHARLRGAQLARAQAWREAIRSRGKSDNYLRFRDRNGHK